jgi:uncharacterized membrane protein
MSGPETSEAAGPTPAIGARRPAASATPAADAGRAAGGRRARLAAVGLDDPLTAALWAGIVVYWVLCLHRMYLAECFAFHDLALTNDYLANTILHGRVFYASELGVNHLGIHFSPTLFLLTPFYALVDSQFVLLFAGAAAGATALLCGLGIFTAVALPGVPPGRARVLRLAFLLLIGMNVYTRTVLAAGHFELVFTMFAAAVLLLVLRDARLPVLVAVTLLACGVREDAGLHLAVPVLALLFVASPAATAAQRRRRWAVVLVATVALVYAAATILVVLPAFGTAHAGYIVQFWGNFGSSPAAIVRTIVTSPLRVLAEVVDSGFTGLNATFGWIALLNPPVFVLTNLTGLIFYISAEGAKKHLWYYNAAFILPGMWLGFAAGLATLERGVAALARGASATRVGAWSAVARALPAVVTVALALRVLADPTSTIGGQVDFRHYPWVDHGELYAAFATHVRPCRGVQSVASDFRSIVFAPNRYQKYMLDRFTAADAIVLVDDESMFFANAQSLPELEAAIRATGRFVRVARGPRVTVYLRRALGCASDDAGA